MRSHLLVLILSALSAATACDLRQPVEPVEVTTHSVTLADGVTIEDITQTPLSSPELETIRLGLKSGGNVILTQSEHQRLVEYIEMTKGVPDTDPAITMFISQLRW